MNIEDYLSDSIDGVHDKIKNKEYQGVFIEFSEIRKKHVKMIK